MEQVQTISTDELRSRPYIFTNFFTNFDEDVYFIKNKRYL
jgi:hypothetical protein